MRDSDTLEKRVVATGPTLNLSSLNDSCEYLKKNCGEFKDRYRTSAYIAFLQPKSRRHVFFLSGVSHIPRVNNDIASLKCSVSLFEYLQREPRESVTVVHQFKLALKLALAVLQYHSTPWLAEEWGISQLQVIPREGKSPDDIPLYLNLKLPGRCSSPSNVRMADEIPLILSDAPRRGIYNTTLFCLGMALLEIGHWKAISAVAKSQGLDSVDTVRMLSERTAGLGKRYDEMVKKCLRCDFAFGTDLSRVELQRAMYNDVVCPLEELISKLDSLSL